MDSLGLLRSLTRLSGRRLHLGVTGSVACLKSAELLRHLLACGVHVSVTLTAGARNFVSPLLFSALGALPVYPELFSGEEPFAHLEPGQTAHGLLVAPASAGILSRMAAGSAEDMLAAQILAFDGPVAVAPAMNCRMWANPATRANAELLKARGVRFIGPEEGDLACGDRGTGRLSAMPVLLAEALRLLAPRDMAGRHALVTMGPTREPWDGVRFWSNPSTGTMGAALALCCWLRGAEVNALAGPGSEGLLPELPGLRCLPVTTARDMFAAAEELWPSADTGLFASAVADFAPEPAGGAKIKKASVPEGFSLRFRPNPDILQTLSARKKPGQKLLGFAAETVRGEDELLALARVKRARKDTDVLAANSVSAEGSGFAVPTNALAVVTRSGKEELWPLQSKADAAWDLCTWLLQS